MTIPNSRELTDEEKQALWSWHIRKKLALKREFDRIKAEEKEIDKAAKNDGFSKTELKDFIDLMTTDDPQKRVDNFRMLERNRIRLGLIQDTRNGDLLSDRVSNLDMIYAAGVEKGLAGLDRITKYAPNSDEANEEFRGYDDGQRIARDNLQAAMEKKTREKNKEAAPSQDNDPFGDND